MARSATSEVYIGPCCPDVMQIYAGLMLWWQSPSWIHVGSLFDMLALHWAHTDTKSWVHVRVAGTKLRHVAPILKKSWFSKTKMAAKMPPQLRLYYGLSICKVTPWATSVRVNVEIQFEMSWDIWISIDTFVEIVFNWYLKLSSFIQANSVKFNSNLSEVQFIPEH